MNLFTCRIHLMNASPSKIVALAREFCCYHVMPGPERSVIASFLDENTREDFLSCIKNRFPAAPHQHGIGSK